MADQRPHTITLHDLEAAVTAAVHQVQQHKAHTLSELAKSPLIMGRWIEKPIPEAEAKEAAAEIARQVGTKVAGITGSPFSIHGPGGTTLGFILREE